MKLKRTIAFIIISTLLYGSMPARVMATTTPSTSDLLASLTLQIATLQTKIAELRAAQTTVQNSAQQVNQTLRLIGNLKEGMTSEEVKLLQALLASDKTLYPEQSVTGYYGKNTVKAIKRFQKKHGLPETGFAGPATREKLNQLLIGAPVAKEDSDDHEDEDRDEKKESRKQDKYEKKGERFCLTIPPGHLIAKGWKKNHDSDDNDRESVLPLCKRLPHGIEKKLTDGGTTTPPVVSDKTAPTISLLNTSAIASSSASVTWATSEAASSKVYYGTTTPLSLLTASNSFVATLTTARTMILSGLSTSTTYYVVAESKDAAHNVATSSQVSFITTP